MAMRKTVEGIELRKTFGRNHYRWVASINDLTIIFTPTLGRYNEKVNGWKWHSRDNAVRSYDENHRPLYIGGSCNRLVDAVTEAIKQTIASHRLAVGLPALLDD